MTTRARGLFFITRASERNDRTISGSMRFREVRAFSIHRGGMLPRNFINPRITEPELDAKSLASLGIHSTFPVAFPSEIAGWFPIGFVRPREIQHCCECQSHHRTCPDEMSGIDALDVQRPTGQERRDGKYGEADGEGIDDRHVAHRVARGKEDHDC